MADISDSKEKTMLSDSNISVLSYPREQANGTRNAPFLLQLRALLGLLASRAWKYQRLSHFCFPNIPSSY